MDWTNLSSIAHWIIQHGYFLMFAAMFIEGPIVTTAAAFAVSLGYFNIVAVFILSILGDITADAIYYFIGYGMRVTVIEKYGKHFGLPTARMEKIRRLLQKHANKTIIMLKLTPVAPVPGFMLVGSTRFSFNKFIFTCFLITLIKTTIFVVVGYYFGMAYNLGLYLKYGDYALLSILIFFILLYYGYKKLFQWLSEKIEKD